MSHRLKLSHSHCIEKNITREDLVFDWFYSYKLNTPNEKANPLQKIASFKARERNTDCVQYGCCFSSHSRAFHSFEDANSAGEELQILTYARHLWSFKQWGIFSVPHLLLTWASVYNGHLWGPVTLTPNAERLAVEQPVAPGIRTPSLQGERSNPLRHAAAVHN